MDKNFIESTQLCQRNWDVSKSIQQEHLDLFEAACRFCPSKQNYSFYNIKFITDRGIIEQIHEITNPNGNGGFGVPIDPLKSINEENVKFYTNPQTLANLLIIFGYSIPYEKQAELKDKFGHHNYPFKRDADMAIGIAMGYLFLIANSLGYKTGGNACYDTNELRNILVVKEDYMPAAMIGIGFADENRNPREHHTDPSFTFPHKPKEKIDIEYYT
jgi:nitroreductase